MRLSATVGLIGQGWLAVCNAEIEIGPHSEKRTYQVAAPAELRTPNLHRANIAHNRVRMEGWRQRRPGSNGKTPDKKRKTNLILTGLLMEGLGANYDVE
jgi:hypothetical protein